MIYLTPCETVRRSFACVTTNDAGDCATHQSAMLMTNRSRGMNTALSLVTDLTAALHDYEVSILDYFWHSNPGNHSNPSDLFLICFENSNGWKVQKSFWSFPLSRCMISNGAVKQQGEKGPIFTNCYFLLAMYFLSLGCSGCSRRNEMLTQTGT